MKTNVDVIKCGNCHYWTGERITTFDKLGKAKVEIRDEFGDCTKEGCKFCDTRRKKSQRCKEFYKWTELL